MRPLDIIDIDLALISELERALAVFLAKGIGFVDFGVFRKLSVGFH